MFYVLRVNVYCHWVPTQLQLKNISTQEDPSSARNLKCSLRNTIAIALMTQTQFSLYPPRRAQFQTAVLVTTRKSIPPSLADSKKPTLFSLESITESPASHLKGRVRY
jgi:hypothetical protein